jgi:parallel beta-helix repeat protein
MRRFLSIALAVGLVLSFSLLTAVPALAESEVWVDDDWTSQADVDLYDDTLTWQTDAFATIQDGIDAADSPGGVVHVAEGTYTENIILTEGIAVLGAGAAGTIIDGGGTGPVVLTNNLTSATIFDGFTVTNGNTDYGGGMRNDSSSPRVSNCIFEGNTASNRGGGMYNLNSSSPTVTGCTFLNNTATSLSGGAIACRSISCPIIANCIFVGNHSPSGGGIYAGAASYPTITDNTIVSNTATNGGGIYVANSSSVITNNIIANNTATTSGGGIYSAAATAPTIDYNDVWSNTSGNYAGCSAGGNDISDDPGFLDAEYHIDLSSPCADVGDNAAVPDDTADLDGDSDTDEPMPYDFEGDPRIWEDAASPTVDIGADEYSDNDPPFAPDVTSSGYRDGSVTDDDTPEFSFVQDDPNYYDTVKYTFQIDDDDDFSSPVVNYTSGLLAQDILESFTSPSLPDGEYYWQVRSTDRFDAEGPWADGSLTPGEPAFILDTSPPPAVSGRVGGEVYPVDKASLLAPWLGLSIVLILAAGGLISARRRSR